MHCCDTLVALYQVQPVSPVIRTSCYVPSSTYFRSKSACANIGSCRIVIALRSSNSVIVSDRFQGRMVSVHASRSNRKYGDGKKEVEVRALKRGDDSFLFMDLMCCIA